MGIKNIAWLLFGISLLPITGFQLYIVYIETFNNNLNLKDLGNLILIFELFLASLTAFKENGHFPLRYLIIFIVSALIFYLSLNKPLMEWYLILTYVFSIIILSLLYILIKYVIKKENLPL